MMYTADEILQKINSFIEQLPYDRTPAALYEPVKYVLSMGGKRIRPTLMLLGYNLYKDDPESILMQAVGLETYHNYTLLHDDLMDNADLAPGNDLGEPVIIRLLPAGAGQAAVIEQQGSGNRAAIDQNGQALLGRIVQSGGAQEAYILQEGSDLMAIIRQQGNGNSASIRQSGSGNSAAIEQIGNDNSASIVQSGSGLNSSVTQAGNGQHVQITQYR